MNDEVTIEQTHQATSEKAESEVLQDSDNVFAQQLEIGYGDKIQAEAAIVPDSEQAFAGQPGSGKADDIQAETGVLLDSESIIAEELRSGSAHETQGQPQTVPDGEKDFIEQPGGGSLDEKALELNSAPRPKPSSEKVQLQAWLDRSKQIAKGLTAVLPKKAVEVFREAPPFAKNLLEELPDICLRLLKGLEKSLIMLEDTRNRRLEAKHLRQVSLSAREDKGRGLWNGPTRLGIRFGLLSSRSEDSMLTFSMDQVLAAFECVEETEDTVFTKVAQGKLQLRRVFARIIGAALFLAVLLLVCYATLTAIACATTRYLAFDETGILVEPAHPTTIAAAASKVAMQPLAVLQSLSPFELQQLAMLRQVEDITFFHQNLLHMLRVSSVALTAVGQLTLKSADGSSLRIEPGGHAYFFSPVQGNEVRLSDQLMNFQPAGTSMYQQPSSSFQKELLSSA